MHTTKPAVAQLAAMPDGERHEATVALESLATPDDVRRRGTELGDTPAGRLYRLRAGLVRVLVAVDHDDITVVGFGSRAAGSASKGPRAQF
ncbi:MAG TPA: hypothetical protein VHD87_15395 [Acidimicrobiales bacterium]|nr:hypothetical protein [Acidimicrobiales bacterium]